MATITRNSAGRTLQASASNAAGATATGAGVDLTGTPGPHLVTGKITNGASGPSAGCDFCIDASHDGSTWHRIYQLRGGTGNGEVSSWAVELMGGIRHVRSVFTGNTGQAVTVESFLHETSSYASN